MLKVEVYSIDAEWDPATWEWRSGEDGFAEMLERATGETFADGFSSRDYYKEHGVEGMMWNIVKAGFGDDAELREPLPVYAPPVEISGIDH